MGKILILGGGFGGIRTALDLEKKLKDKVEIILIDKNSYHLFAPALYEVASAYGIKKDPFAIRLKKTICIPYADIFLNKKIGFIQAEIFSIDLENKKIATRGGEILNYDCLVIALGSQAADFNAPGVKEYAFQFKVLEDALLLNKKTEELTKEAATGQRARPIKMTIVGAGFTGIEIAAEFSCYFKKLAKTYLPAESERRAKKSGKKEKGERIILLEANPKILPTISDDERTVILKRLTRLGIEVMEGAAAEEVGSDYIKLNNGKQISTDIIIWTAGIRLPDLLEKTPGLPLTEKKKIKVNNCLEVEGLSGVFAIGDNIEFIDAKTNKPIPALAYIAVNQGKIVAKNISRLLNNKKAAAYDPLYGVWIIPIGGKYALAHLGGLKVKGFLGWILRELVDFKYMLSMLPLKKAFSIMRQEITLFTKND